MDLPIGWAAGWGAPRRGNETRSTGIWNDFFGALLGLLITALAATMGAPFWLDLLNKVMVIRSIVKPHEKSQEEASEDRQFPKMIAQAPGQISSQTKDGSETSPAILHGITNIRDTDSSIDGYEVQVEVIADDEQLPAAERGVA